VTDNQRNSSTIIEQIRAELEAATPGPWVVGSDGRIWDVHEPVGGERCITGFAGMPLYFDGELIAHAPAYLAALLDVAEAAQSLRGAGRLKKNPRLTSALERLDQVIPQEGPG
jgi:hypothetical protein